MSNQIARKRDISIGGSRFRHLDSSHSIVNPRGRCVVFSLPALSGINNLRRLMQDLEMAQINSGIRSTDMDIILLHISAPKSMANRIVTENLSVLDVISSRELGWQDMPRFGLAEGILIIGTIKGLAELGKVVIEIVRLLKESGKNENVQVELPSGIGVTISSDDDPQAAIQTLSKSLEK